MRKPLFDIQETELYLHGKMDAPDKLLFEAKMIIDHERKINMLYQQKTYSIIRWFGRKKQKHRLESIFDRLMKDEKFASTINSIFA